MGFSIYYADEWLYPDSELSSGKTLTLHAAKGGSVGFQVKLTGLGDNTSLSVCSDNESAEFFRLIDVNVPKNTGRYAFTWTEDNGDPSDYVTKTAPFRVYDAMKPFENGEKVSDIVGLFVNINIPRDYKAGDYTVKFTVKSDKETVNFDILLNVFDVALPEKETLFFTNWFNISNMAVRHNVEEWSEEHWEMIRKYGIAMRRSRQNIFWVPGSVIDTKKIDGKYTFDFSKAKRLIEMYLGLGFTMIEGGQFAYRKGWEDPDLFVNDGENEYTASSEEAYTYVSSYLSAWNSFLKENGWYDIYIQHIMDEPNDACKLDYFRLACMARKFLPGIKIIEAVEIAGLAGAVDIWVPKNYYYEDHRDQYETFRKAGDTLWYYTCCVPGGKYINRQLDKPLIHVRYLHWGNFKFDLPGFLHWGFNFYYPYQDPFEDSTPVHGAGNTVFLPSGDTNIAYPGNEAVLGSVRLENHRYGAEDYELFRLLEAKNPAKAHELCDSLIRTFSDVDLDPEHMEEVKAKLLAELVK